MGLYLNSKKPYTIYKRIAQSAYFIDKTAMLEQFLPLAESANTLLADSLTEVLQDPDVLERRLLPV